MKSKIIIGIVAAVAVLGGGYTVSRMDFIGTGKVGIVYNYKDGVQDTVLTPGMHFSAPMNKVKEFSTSNEILVLTKDKRDGSKEDDSFKVATSDDASIAVSFQMSYLCTDQFRTGGTDSAGPPYGSLQCSRLCHRSYGIYIQS